MTTHKVRQRKAIALDVIAQIKARRYIAETRLYVGMDDDYCVDDAKPTADLQKLLMQEITKNKPCRVCGLGSCFISAVRLYDNEPVSALQSERNGDFPISKMRRALRRFFSVREQQLIEASFECDSRFIGGVDTEESDAGPTIMDLRQEFNNAEGFVEALSYLNDEDRLIFLMGAVVNLADKRITLQGLRDQLIYALVSFKPLAGQRAAFSL